MPSYKYYFFDVRGIGEVSRQLLHLGGQQFKDVRYTFESFPNHKHGYAGKNDFDAALVDALGDQFKDYFAEMRPYYIAALEIFPGDKAVTRPQGEAARLKFYPFLEKRLSESKSGFLVGDSLTWIDLFLADHVDIVRNIPGFLNEYPKVLAHSTKVRSDPKLKVWLDKRPATRF